MIAQLQSDIRMPKGMGVSEKAKTTGGRGEIA